MYTKEKLYRRKRKSIRGWIYSLAAALFLIVMAAVLLAAKWPEEGEAAFAYAVGKSEAGKELRRLRAEPSGTFDEVWELMQDSETERRLWTERIKAPLIVIDPGHGGIDSGCPGGSGRVMEKDINLGIALLVRDKLEEKGFRVIMTRETDEFLSKEERALLANSHQADAYVSIHQNTYEGKDKSIGGIETWYDGSDEERDSGALAACVHREAVASAGAVERSLIDSDELYVLSKTLMPSCLIETGFLSNPEECRRLSDTAYQERLAEGIAEGIAEYILTKDYRSGK